VIERQFRGRKHFVEVAADGFRYEGRQNLSTRAGKRSRNTTPRVPRIGSTDHSLHAVGIAN
jgi:hypothetical protein